ADRSPLLKSPSGWFAIKGGQAIARGRVGEGSLAQLQLARGFGGSGVCSGFVSGGAKGGDRGHAQRQLGAAGAAERLDEPQRDRGQRHGVVYSPIGERDGDTARADEWQERRRLGKVGDGDDGSRFRAEKVAAAL